MKHIVSLTLLILISIILFSNTFKNSFVWEDEFTIIENKYIRNIKNIPLFFSPEFWKHYPIAQGQYRPVRITTFTVDYSLWKLNPFGYHLTNLLLHILNVVLVYFLIYRLAIIDKNGKDFTENSFTSFNKTADEVSDNRSLLKRFSWFKLFNLPFLTALFFATHPIHVESITWIKNRSEPLAALFFLLSLLLFIRYLSPRNSNSPILYYLGAILCFVLAIFSKETALPLPLILILYAVCFLPKEEYKKTIIKTLPFFVLIILYFIFKKIFIGTLFSAKNVYTIGIYSNVMVVFKTIGYYLRLLIFPFNLNAEHFFSIPKSFFELAIFSSLVVLFFLLIIVIKTFKYSKLLSFALLWIFLTILPASNIMLIAGRPIAEQRLYIPSLGFCLLLAMAVRKLFYLETRFIPQKILRNLVALCSILMLIFYSFTIIKRNLDWRDPLTFWSKTVESSPKSFRAHNNLGIAYNKMGKNEEAIALYKKALELNPFCVDAYYNIGVAYEDMHDKEEAIALYKKTIELNPNYINAYYNLGNVYYALGKNEEAISLFKKTIEIDSNYAKAYNNLGAVYRDLGQYEESLEYLQKAIELEPDYAEAYYNLGLRYDSLALYQETIRYYQKAIEIAPDLVEAYNNLGAVHRDLGQYEKAIAYLKKAIILKPDFLLAHKNLAIIYYDQGLFSLAKSQWERVLEIDPNQVIAEKNLAELKKMGY